jgi:hypothetical protein
LWGECLGWAGPAGWLRESGSGLPHSKVTAAVTGGRLVGRGLGWCRASGLAPGKRQQASAFQGLRPAGLEEVEEARLPWGGCGVQGGGIPDALHVF